MVAGDSLTLNATKSWAGDICTLVSGISFPVLKANQIGVTVDV